MKEYEKLKNKVALITGGTGLGLAIARKFCEYGIKTIIAAVFLISDAARYITGVVLRVDGGNSIGF